MHHFLADLVCFVVCFLYEHIFFNMTLSRLFPFGGPPSQRAASPCTTPGAGARGNSTELNCVDQDVLGDKANFTWDGEGVVAGEPVVVLVHLSLNLAKIVKKSLV